MKKSLCILLSGALAAASGCHAHYPEQESKLQRLRDEQEMRDRSLDLAPSDDEGLQENILGVAMGVLVFPFVALGQAMEHVSGPTPAAAAREMDSPGNPPDTRRSGLTALVTRWDFAKRPPYTTRYKQIAQNDSDFTTRAMAIRALNISRDRSATPLFIVALEDDNELVRLEAAKALANVPDPNAIQPLLRRLEGKRETMVEGRPEITDESKDVRIAATDALRHYKNLDVARSLVNQLNEREFGVAWQARKSLITLTGQDLKYDEVAWLQYLTGPSKPFG